MRIGSVGMSFQPYIYNTNTVSSKSLEKIQGIGNDVLTSKTDFSNLTDEANETTNPIKRGQSLNFADIIGMQMQMSRLNESRIMSTSKVAEEANQAAGVAPVGDVINVADMNPVSAVNEAQSLEQVSGYKENTMSPYEQSMMNMMYQPIDVSV